MGRGTGLRSSPKIPHSLLVARLPEAKLEAVLDRAVAVPRWGGRCRFLWWWWRRRWWRLLLGPGDGEGQLRRGGLSETGQEVCGDVLGAGAGAAAPLGLAPLVEGHVPLAARAAAAVHGRGVGVVAVLLEALPELALGCEMRLWKARGGHKDGLAPPSLSQTAPSTVDTPQFWPLARGPQSPLHLLAHITLAPNLCLIACEGSCHAGCNCIGVIYNPHFLLKSTRVILPSAICKTITTSPAVNGAAQSPRIGVLGIRQPTATNHQLYSLPSQQNEAFLMQVGKEAGLGAAR